jgi:hypothetical protein
LGAQAKMGKSGKIFGFAHFSGAAAAKSHISIEKRGDVLDNRLLMINDF